MLAVKNYEIVGITTDLWTNIKARNFIPFSLHFFILLVVESYQVQFYQYINLLTIIKQANPKKF